MGRGPNGPRCRQICPLYGVSSTRLERLPRVSSSGDRTKEGDDKGSGLPRIRESKYRWRAPVRVRTGDRDVRGGRIQPARRLVRAGGRQDWGPAQEIRREAATAGR